MVLMKNISQNLNKRLSDIELAHEFRYHGLYFEYLKSENLTDDEESQTTSVSSWRSSRPASTISTRFQELKIQDSIFFQKWWKTIRKRKHSPRKTDVIEMLDAIQSNEHLLLKLNKIFGEYDHFMMMYRRLERLIQKQLFLVVCQHSIVVLVTIHLLVEVYLEWGDLLDEKSVQLVHVNFIAHLVQILHDFGCLALTAIICRNEASSSYSDY